MHFCAVLGAKRARKGLALEGPCDDDERHSLAQLCLKQEDHFRVMLPFDTEKLKEKLDEWQERAATEEGGARPQARAAIAPKGEILHEGFAGEYRPGVPVGDDSIFRTCSNAKPIACIAVTQLVE